MSPGQVRVIGLGNAYRGDDAAGLAVAGLVRAGLTGAGLGRAGLVPGVEVTELEGEPISLLDLWAGASAVYLVDAVVSGGAPGAVYRFDASAVPSQAGHRGTHAISLGEVIEIARHLGRLPARLVGYGIEAERLTAGVGLSPAVDAAVRRTAALLLDELAVLGSGAG